MTARLLAHWIYSLTLLMCTQSTDPPPGWMIRTRLSRKGSFLFSSWVRLSLRCWTALYYGCLRPWPLLLICSFSLSCTPDWAMLWTKEAHEDGRQHRTDDCWTQFKMTSTRWNFSQRSFARRGWDSRFTFSVHASAGFRDNGTSNSGQLAAEIQHLGSK